MWLPHLCVTTLTPSTHAQQALWYLVCACVCVSVGTYSHITRNKVAKMWYQCVQCHTGLIFKMAIFVNPLCSKVMVLNMLMSTASPRLVFAALHTLKLLKGKVVSQRVHSNAIYEYSYPVGLSKDCLWACGCGLYMAVPRIFNGGFFYQKRGPFGEILKTALSR